MSRTFLVTGAASGIGAHLAAELLRRGERVCAVDINAAPMEALRTHAASVDSLMIATLDVRDPAQWQQRVAEIAARWGRLDVLMNVAGVLRVGYVHELRPDDVHFQFDINTKGVIFGMHAAVQQMLRQGRGHIINVASLAGIAPVPGLSLYSASKFAVRGYSLATALELRDRNIQVSVVCPDAVQTPMLDIQKDKEQAALTFSGPRSLSTQEVVDAILGPALQGGKLEVMLPASRGWTAKLASLFPALAGGVLDALRKKGLDAQKKLRSRSS